MRGITYAIEMLNRENTGELRRADCMAIIETWVNELGAALPATFLVLDLEAKLLAIAVFAHIANDETVKAQAKAIIKALG